MVSFGDISEQIDQAADGASASPRLRLVLGGDSQTPADKLALQLYDNALGYYRSQNGQNTPQATLDALHQYADNRANWSLQSGGLTYANEVSINTLGQAAGLPIAFISSSAATAPATPSQDIFNQIAKTVSDAAKATGTAISDVSKGNLAGAGNALAAGAKQTVADAGAVTTHIESSIASVAKDVANGVEGAFNTLKALVSGLTPSGLVALVEKDLSGIVATVEAGMGLTSSASTSPAAGPIVPSTLDRRTLGLSAPATKAPLDPNEIDFSFLPIPRTGLVANLFPSQLRGQTIHWADAKNNAGKIIWYLAALTVVDFEHMVKLCENMLGGAFKSIESFLGIKGADAKRDPSKRTLGLAPVAAAAAQAAQGGASTVLPIVIGVITAATALVAALSPLIVTMLKGKAGPVTPPPPLPPGTMLGPNGLPVPLPPNTVLGPNGLPIPAPGFMIGPNGAIIPSTVGHSSTYVTVGVVGLILVLVVILFWPEDS